MWIVTITPRRACCGGETLGAEPLVRPRRRRASVNRRGVRVAVVAPTFSSCHGCVHLPHPGAPQTLETSHTGVFRWRGRTHQTNPTTTVCCASRACVALGCVGAVER